MACSGAYATSWEYASFWCVGSIITGTADNTHATVLTDATVHFINLGAKPNLGMVVYNLTTGTNGLITAVTETTMTSDIAWTIGDLYRAVFITQAQIAVIEHYLNITVGNIHAAMAASDQCSCTLAAWATNELSKLNIIMAGVFHECPCGSPQLSSEEKSDYLLLIKEDLAMIRKSEMELCAGETGADFPVTSWAEQAITEFAAAKIIANDIDRNTT